MVFAYYILATLLPVDKIIGKIYPIFAVALLFMAVGIGILQSVPQFRHCRIPIPMLLYYRSFLSCLSVLLAGLYLVFMLRKAL